MGFGGCTPFPVGVLLGQHRGEREGQAFLCVQKHPEVPPPRPQDHMGLALRTLQDVYGVNEIRGELEWGLRKLISQLGVADAKSLGEW